MTKSFIGTFVLIFAAMAALFLFDSFLERTEVTESRAEARRLFDEGRRLLAQRRPADAVERLRGALTFDRGNTAYRLALTDALLSSGKLSDAESSAQVILDGDPANGAANLTMARIVAREGLPADAASYYHRAIYGRWPQNPARRRLEVRLEFVDLLARQDKQQDLLAELLPLSSESLDLPTREHIAQLYVTAGSPNRAVDMFREILRERPSDPGAFAGMGTAEFAKGNYRAAHLDFLIASRLKPSPALQKQLALSAEVLALDPTLRGIGQQERVERSKRLLQLAIESVTECLGPNALPFSAVPGKTNDAVESNMELAEKIWHVRHVDCRQPLTQNEQALSLVLIKIQ